MNSFGALRVEDNLKEGLPTKISVNEQEYLNGRYFSCADPKALLLIVHGLQGHSLWPHGGAWFAERGVCSLSFDRRGSGKSSGLRGHMNHYKDFVEDLRTGLNFLKEKHPGVPVHIMANSLGAFPSLLLSLEECVESVILAAPGFYTQKSLDYSLIKKLNILLGDPLKKHYSPLKDKYLVSKDPWLDWLHSDTLGTRKLTASLLKNVLFMKKAFQDKLKEMRVPVYLILASQDCVVDNHKTIQKFYSKYQGPKKIRTFSSEHYLYFSEEYKKIGASVLEWMKIS